MSIHPIIQMDFPDPDVIRVEDTYYMVSTTMHFIPGCVILRSYDLRNWEIVERVYDYLDETEGQRLQNHSGIYGKGMWAASIRYHKNRFYLCFVANDTGKTYLYQRTFPDPRKSKKSKAFIMTRLFCLMKMAESILCMEIQRFT